MPTIDKRFDVLVVGSGATGSIAVKELTERGLDVLLLEAGRDITDADFTPPPQTRPRPMGPGVGPRIKAGLRGQPVQARRAFFSASASPFLVDDRANPYTTPRGRYFLWIRGRVLGGRLHTYGRMLLRMSQYDFGGGDGRDAWPISYADLEPWYDHIETFIGLYGNADGLKQLPDGKYRGPGKLTKLEQEFKRTVEQRWPERKVVSWRYAAPNPHRVPLGILAARETGRLTTRTDAIVKQITVDDKTGRATGAVFVDRLTKREHRVSADIVVLCASTIESVRLLLNSASRAHPDGLGNSSGLLGRYFMDQTPSLIYGSSREHRGWESVDIAPPDPFYPPAGGTYIPRYDNLDRRTNPDYVTGFAFQGVMGRLPVPDDCAANAGMMGFGEMLPNYDNTVTINRRKVDTWGIPVPHINVKLTDNDRALLRAQVGVSREMFEYAGFDVNFVGSALGLDSGQIFPDADPVSRFIFRRSFRKSLSIGAAIHECGGARMGSDPRTSVLNSFNQSWDVPNVFVTDASCYVTNGGVGPTLTIMALTARACDYIAREHASGSGP
ncbi:MAG: GMC family oxidoreductase [Chloroflexi bacterium]|nr:GMC family oxidoreductase [Chloroflexota bacterium]